MTENNENKKSNKLKYTELEVGTGVDRRKFLGLIGASMALAGVTTTGCIRRPKEYIYPETQRPENTLPGVPKNYSTSALIGNTVLGLSVTSTDGRPTKIDGNYRHFMSNPILQSTIGSSNSFAQAEILNLYEPERGQHCLVGGDKVTKQEALKQVKDVITLNKKQNGKGLAVVYETNASPSFVNQLIQFQKACPEALFIEQDTTYSANRLEGLSLVAGKNVDVVYDISKAKTILAVDSDFLGTEGNSVKNARQFAENRRVLDANSTMNRLYSVESNISITGAAADHRYTMHSNFVGNFVVALYRELNVNSITLPLGLDEKLVPKVPLDNNLKKWVKAVAKDLASHAGHSIVIVGDKQPAWVHALGFAINYSLGAISTEVISLVPNTLRPSFVKTMPELVNFSAKNPIQTLIIIGGNPVYTQPVDVEFSKVLSKATNSVYLGYSPDETARLVNYYLPQTHFLESWGDTLSTDGTFALRQPLIAPLFDDCVNEYEFISNLIDSTLQSDYNIVKNYLKSSPVGSAADFELNWRQYLSDGVVKGYPKPETIDSGFNFETINTYYAKYIPLPEPTAAKLNIDFILDRSMYDGRYSNNSWMQELPDPITKLVWDNSLLISPKTAKALGLNGNPKPGTSNVDVVKVTYNNRSLEAAVWEVPGIADFTLVLPLGYGRQFGQVAKGTGFNANLIRTANSWTGSNVTVELTGRSYSLVSMQEHGSQNGTPNLTQDRPSAVREATLDNFKKEPNFVLNYELIAPEEQKSHLFKYPENPTQVKWARQQWGMSIDLNTCIGCNACTIACQAENNISVVGKEEIF